MADKQTKKRFFLIDYENVHQSGLTGYQNLSQTDTLIIFCSNSANALNGQMLAELQSKNIPFEVKNAMTGAKNAMDFQIATEVGRLIGTYGVQCSCIIISNDQGFQAVCNYWKKEHQAVSIAPMLTSVFSTAAKTPNPQPVAVHYPYEQDTAFAEAVKGIRLGKANRQKLYELLQCCAQETISAAEVRKLLSDRIIQEFGSEHAEEFYQAVLPLLKEKTEESIHAASFEELIPVWGAEQMQDIRQLHQAAYQYHAPADAPHVFHEWLRLNYGKEEADRIFHILDANHLIQHIPL